MTEDAKKPLGRILLKQHAVSQADLDRALANPGHDGTPLATRLIESGTVSEIAALKALSEQSGVPGIDLNQICLRLSDLAVLQREMAVRHKILPVLEREDRIFLAMAAPTEKKVIDELEFVTGKRVFPYIALSGQLVRAIAAAYEMRDRGETHYVGPQCPPEVLRKAGLAPRTPPAAPIAVAPAPAPGALVRHEPAPASPHAPPLRALEPAPAPPHAPPLRAPEPPPIAAPLAPGPAPAMTAWALEPPAPQAPFAQAVRAVEASPAQPPPPPPRGSEPGQPLKWASRNPDRTPPPMGVSSRTAAPAGATPRPPTAAPSAPAGSLSARPAPTFRAMIAAPAGFPPAPPPAVISDSVVSALPAPPIEGGAAASALGFPAPSASPGPAGPRDGSSSGARPAPHEETSSARPAPAPTRPDPAASGPRFPPPRDPAPRDPTSPWGREAPAAGSARGGAAGVDELGLEAAPTTSSPVIVDDAMGKMVIADELSDAGVEDANRDLSVVASLPEEGSAGDGRRTILVVDDEPDIRRLLRRVLEDRNYRVLEADRGLAALRLVKEHVPDLLILDAMLPELHGFDIARRMKGSVKYGAIPIIMVSAVYRGWRIAEDLKAGYGVDAYIEKPFKVSDVVAAVEKALASRAGKADSESVSADADKRLAAGIEAYRVGDLARAIEELREGTRLDPLAYRLHFHLGLLYGKQGQVYDAIQELETALEINGRHFPALKNLAVLYQKAGFRNKALETWERALIVAPDEPTRSSIKEHLLGLL